MPPARQTIFRTNKPLLNEPNGELQKSTEGLNTQTHKCKM